jgi:hypothetical protein
MTLMVFGFVLLIGVVLATALFLAARSAHSDVISSEMHDIDSNTQSLDISGPSSPQRGRRINLFLTPALLILRCPMLKLVAFKTVYTAMKGTGRGAREVRRMGRFCGAQPQAAPGQFESQQALLARGGGSGSSDYDAATGAWIDTVDAED